MCIDILTEFYDMLEHVLQLCFLQMKPVACDLGILKYSCPSALKSVKVLLSERKVEISTLIAVNLL